MRRTPSSWPRTPTRPCDCSATRPTRTAILGAFTYSRNETLLHTDSTVLPAARRARASWNYRMDACAGETDDVQVSYWMNRLQDLDEPLDYLVTLNATDRIDPGTVLRRMVYEHPVYTRGLDRGPAAAARR